MLLVAVALPIYHYYTLKALTRVESKLKKLALRCRLFFLQVSRADRSVPVHVCVLNVILQRSRLFELRQIRVKLQAVVRELADQFADPALERIFPKNAF